ncbi:hypothetical protein C8R43DRAFT_827218, partial [Mycena crocata]
LGSDEAHTVFEGEGVGGTLALVLLSRQPDVEGPVTVVVDSQPAARATRTALSTPSHWIWDEWQRRWEALMETHPEIEVTVRWAPGHRDIPGNERADEEAKKASQLGSSEARDIPRAFR